MDTPTGLIPREVTARPSTPRTAFLKKRYLEAPLRVDVEYIRLLTESHRRSDGLPTLERRAQDHAYALERITPIIHPQETIAANKTRFIRGAVPYANYAAGPFLKEMRLQAQDAQQKHIEQGRGGGIAGSLVQAQKEGCRVFSGKFLISPEEYESLRETCEYWEDKCFMSRGEQLWTEHFPEADFIEKGWAIGLYTAPHEPCPEGRLILDHETSLAKGYGRILDEIDGRLLSFRPGRIHESGKIEFWRAAKRVLQGALVFAENYAKEAQRLAGLETDRQRQGELLRMARACQRVPREPPRDFREAVQSFWFTYLLGHLEGSHLGYSPGRLDQTLWPYYQKGGVSYQEAVEVLEELFVKMTQIEYLASLSWQGLGHGNLYQNLVLGGLDGQGRPADNELSLAILDAQIRMQMTQPTLSVWHDDSLSERFLLKAAECVKTGVGYPAFFNLKTYIRHETKTSGIALETVRKYAAIGGCTEPVLQGMSYGVVQAGFVNHGKLLDLTMNDGADPVTGDRLFEPRSPKTYEELRASYLDKMRASVRRWQQYWNHVMRAHRDTVPLVFCSVFVRDCLDRGLCMDDGGAVLNRTPTTLSSGLVNVANSFAAIKKLCFEDGACGLEGLKAALAADWVGHEALRKRALLAPKWGNDDDDADSVFLDLFSEYCSWVAGQDNSLGEPYDPSMLAISTPVPFGKACAAFPDGRRSGEPLADGVTSPFPGTDVQGPTAVARSSGKVDHSLIRGGLLNLKFHPSALRGEKGSRNLLAFIKTYFEKPGFHVQFNVVDSRMLRDAQKRPEAYRDLVVRVAGFSAYWVEMSQALQDQVIWRTEHGL